MLITANVVPSSLILLGVMTEAIRSSELSVLTKAASHHIDGIHHLKVNV
jgi:hypothetical protein